MHIKQSFFGNWGSTKNIKKALRIILYNIKNVLVFIGVQNNQIDLFGPYNFNRLGCKDGISIFRLSISVLTSQALLKNQRLRA